MDNELLLFDRIEVIKETNKKYDLENNAYLSFSGGKDSTVLHYLLDIALPGNQIPRVYIDTGIEYQAIKDFVLELAKTDKRIEIVKPTLPIKATLEKYGYPFKSKEHSGNVELFQNGNMCKNLERYLGEGNYTCPKVLRYQFTKDVPFKISNRCCSKLKKEPAKKWERKNNRFIAITGMQRSEGGKRQNLQCIMISKDNKHIKFHPLAVVNDDWENWFIKEQKIKLCKLYYEPYNFKRTGCKGCPYNLNLKQDLETMAMLLPNERKQCEIIWHKVYEEYRRLNYRLDNSITLWD